MSGPRMAPAWRAVWQFAASDGYTIETARSRVRPLSWWWRIIRHREVLHVGFITGTDGSRKISPEQIFVALEKKLARIQRAKAGRKA